MIKTKKGQIIILDVLFAVVIIILMFFLLMKLAEIQMYKTNSDKSIEKLNNVGTLAYKRFLNNPEINCKVTDSANSFYLPGTIFTNTSITKDKLGISSDYNCSLIISDVVLTNECNQILTDTNLESYNIDFSVVVCNSNLSKQQYTSYTSGTSTPQIEQVSLKIWRN